MFHNLLLSKADFYVQVCNSIWHHNTWIEVEVEEVGPENLVQVQILQVRQVGQIIYIPDQLVAILVHNNLNAFKSALLASSLSGLIK